MYNITNTKDCSYLRGAKSILTVQKLQYNVRLELFSNNYKRNKNNDKLKFPLSNYSSCKSTRLDYNIVICPIFTQ